MPTKKNNKVISKRSQAKQNKNPLFLIAGGILVLLIASLLVFNNKPAKYTPEVSGSPSLQVDEELVDLGDVQLGKTVQTAFKISNVGDQELRFTQKPYVEVKEGCWPPTPVIGSMTLKPGESTTVTMQFMMHGDMGGPHDFRLHLPNNDPSKQDLSLTVLSNWVP